MPAILQTVWPFMLGFPRDGMGVVDAVCMASRAARGCAGSVSACSLLQRLPRRVPRRRQHDRGRCI